ncbi:Vascular-related nac-domain, partial [Thalictrum thalictroides]
MVSKRQILARKKFKEENPELFPKHEQPRCKDPEKKKKKDEKYKAKLKRKKGDNKNKKNKKGGFSKHPLRVPGMKPGESCYICKAKDHIAKLCPQKAEWEKNK